MTGSEWDTQLYQDRHAFVWRYGADLVELLAPRAGERILDLGCGTGQLTQQIAASGATVTGVDNSPAMIEEARRNHPDLRFEIADARDFTFAEPFDAVFSNAVLHWIKEPEMVVASVSRALMPGGRFVAELGGRGNVEAIVRAIYEARTAAGLPGGEHLNPWYYPSIAEYASLLEQHGLMATFATLFDRPTPLEDGDNGMRNWLTMFCGRFFEDVSEAVRPALIETIEALLRRTLYREGTWYADYRRLRIVASKDPSASVL